MICSECKKEIILSYFDHYAYDFDGGTEHFCSHKCASLSLQKDIYVIQSSNTKASEEK